MDLKIKCQNNRQNKKGFSIEKKHTVRQIIYIHLYCFSIERTKHTQTIYTKTLTIRMYPICAKVWDTWSANTYKFIYSNRKIEFLFTQNEGLSDELHTHILTVPQDR